MSQPIRLPSISELTSKYPLNDSGSIANPKGHEGSAKLVGISPFNYRYVQSSPTNYSFSGKPKLSPTIPYTQPPPPIASPSNYQYYHLQSVSPYPNQAFYQPVYYQPSPPPSNVQYAVPVVINRPTNKCHRCGTTETPEWRRGPNGVRTLCNACGLFHAKLVKRKGAALAAKEVLNNKVTKGKNGRRISIEKHLSNENLRKKSASVSPVYHQQQMPSPQLPAPQIPSKRAYNSGMTPDYRQPVHIIRE